MDSAVPLAAAVDVPGVQWDQGDIVDAMYFFATDEQRPALLVTPTCDVAQDKLPFWTFVALFRDDEVGRQLMAGELAGFGLAPEQLSRNQKKQLLKIADNLIRQRYPRYQWIPVTIEAHTGFVADFALVQSMPVAEVKQKATRIARLRSSWREQAPVRYASYLGRIGTDDFANFDAVAERVLDAALAGV